MQSDNPKIFFLTVRLFRQEDRLLAAWLRRDAIASYVCLCSCKLQFIGEFAAVGRALTKTFIHSPFMLFEPSAIPLWYIWSYENKFSRPYMP